MKKIYLQMAVRCLGIVAFLAVLGWAGDIDYTEQVILRMSGDDYERVRDTLTRLNGHEPSQREIAHWWEEHREETPATW